MKEKCVKVKKKKMRKRLSDLCFLFPSLAGVAIFFVIPFGVVFYYSVIDSPFNPEFVFLDNFKALLHNQAFLQAAGNTIHFSLLAVPLAVLLALIFAVILEQNIPGKSVFRTCFLTPLMVPTASVVLVWQVFFGFNGVINEFIQKFGGDKIDWFKSSHAQVVILILFIWKNLGYNMILFLAALSGIPKDHIEAASLDGANGWQTFWYIKLRYLSPTILFVAIMSLINSFKVFREVYLLTGDYPYDTLYMLQHFMNNMFKSMDYQKLSAAAVLMLLVMTVIIGGLFLLDEKIGKDVEG
ncbi:MAG: carbohydrate ABC transporter permease [Wujia sp.]